MFRDGACVRLGGEGGDGCFLSVLLGIVMKRSVFLSTADEIKSDDMAECCPMYGLYDAGAVIMAAETKEWNEIEGEPRLCVLLVIWDRIVVTERFKCFATAKWRVVFRRMYVKEVAEWSDCVTLILFCEKTSKHQNRGQQTKTPRSLACSRDTR